MYFCMHLPVLLRILKKKKRKKIPEHNTAKLYASARTRPLNSRPRALALAMYPHIYILRI